MSIPTILENKQPFRFFDFIELIRFATMSAFSVIGMIVILENLISVKLTNQYIWMFFFMFAAAIITKIVSFKFGN